MCEVRFIQTAEKRFDEIAGEGYRHTPVGSLQFSNFVTSLSRGSCVSILKTEYGIESHICPTALDQPSVPAFADY